MNCRLDWRKVADELNHPRFAELRGIVGVATSTRKQDEAKAFIRRDVLSE
jgi:hypothetical protein